MPKGENLNDTSNACPEALLATTRPCQLVWEVCSCMQWFRLQVLVFTMLRRFARKAHVECAQTLRSLCRHLAANAPLDPFPEGDASRKEAEAPGHRCVLLCVPSIHC